MMRFLSTFFGREGLSCDEVMELLQAYLDSDSATPEEAKQVADHLKTCHACDRESQVYNNMKISLAARQRPVDADVMRALRRFGEDLLTTSAD